MKHIRRIPFTILFLSIMVLANWFAGTLAGTLPAETLSNWGISHQTVVTGDLARLITGTFLSHDLGMFLRQLIFAGAVIGYFEWHGSTLRTAITYFSIDIVGSVIVLFAVVPLVAAIPEIGQADARATLDVGMSAGGFGLIGAILASWPHKWLLLGAVVAAIVVKVWYDLDVIADSAHLICLLIGFAVQQTLSVRSRSWDRKEGLR
ncbi:hypothetical protein [Sedimentitalea todarodis]|uniref:Peptidase S54 rhomboid domain-containing protein n=1 Tax=Sedimentitalea todarodis TaxID=1631240 RepID=A0ABU3VEH6_9RHOB|nr:hypothetical protein [Sedimentitalea todarodis]MDU9004583.1 hypothetical protein [Sedimentitalea todarodis]